MQTPEELKVLGDSIFPILQELQEEILKDVARRIDKTSRLTESAKWQIERAEAIKANRSEIRKLISKYSKKTDLEIDKIFKEAATKSLDSDYERYLKAYDKGLIDIEPFDFFATQQAQQVFEAALKKTKGEIANLTATLISNNSYFIKELDKAHNKVVSGAFSIDKAVRDAVKELSKELTRVQYPSGRRDFVDVATWRAVRTGASQTAGTLSMMNFDMMGANLVKVTVHLGARITHAPWQGETFWVNTPVKGFRNFYEVTEYGTVGGLKGANCRHDFYPVFEGLDDLSKEKSPTGNEEAAENEKTARSIERNIRALKREKAAFKAIGDKDNVKALSLEIDNETDKYKAHIDKHELQYRNERLLI